MMILTWDELRFKLTKEELEDLKQWLRGQTVPIGGVYRHDYERWRMGLPILD